MRLLAVCEMNAKDISAEEVLRIIIFFVGLILLVSGFADFGRLGGLEVLAALSIGGTAFLKVIIGVFLMLAGLSPKSVEMIIKAIIRR